MLKNSKTFKRVLSIVLSMVMMLTMLPVTSIKVLAGNTVTIKAHFINSGGWENVYAYAGEGATWTLCTDTWPGDLLSKDGAGYYTYEVTKSSSSALNFIFNDGIDSNKTTDLSISSSALSSDADGIVDVWVKADSSVSYTAPTGGPTINGNQVTFRYESSTANNVYLAGTMNGWSTTSTKLTKNNNVFTSTLELEPGIYEYKFVVDSQWITDPNNSYVLGGGNCVVIVPGFITTNISVKKGGDITLPSELIYVSSGGETTKEVTYTSLTSGVNVVGTKVTLSEDFTATEFYLTAQSADGYSTTVKVQIYEPEDITVKIHYDRTDNAESDWNVWIWSDNQGGQACEFILEDGEYVATYKISPEDAIYTNSLNYIIRKGEWVSQEATRTIDLKNVVSGTVHSYVGTDGNYSNDISSATLGTKINSIDYDRANNKIIVESSGLVSNPDTDFIITESDGSVINITDVKQSGTRYILSIGEDLSSIQKVCGTYKLTYDGNEYFVSMPNIYKTQEFESTYTYQGNDLGATYKTENTTFKVWAPTAESVKVQLYSTGSDEEEGSAKLGTYTMTKGSKGVWSVVVQGDLKNVYYTYLTDVNGNVEESCDPYARTTGVNSERAMVIDLDSTDPEGWDKDVSPNRDMEYTDAIIYELHIRDLSINEESGVKDEWKGKFLGLTQEGTTNNKGIPTGLDHIKDLGITHIHLLPSYDFGSIDETMTEEEKEADTSKQFNWGYDPVNYNVPEGSYSTNPYDGNSRVSEMKKMIQTLHENEINVIMDVVYNHVYDAGNFCFNEIVPDYFSRTNADGSYSNGSGCGNDTASERAMVRKYIIDSVKYWADEYHIDGFRFDLVGLLDAETINQVVDEVHKTHPDVIFYGEGWTMVTAVEPSNTIMATQKNAYATPKFAYFSDTFRDFLKGKNDETTWGYVQGATEGDQEGVLIECFKANTSWIKNPTQVINYASCHDNYTLMDKINATKSSSSFADRIKMNNLAASIYMLAEGIPLIHAGEEMLRIKVDSNGNIIHNSYNSPDYINSLKWGDLDSEDYQSVRDYYKGLIEFRKNHAALRLTTKTAVNNNVQEWYIEDNVVMFEINGKGSIANEVADKILVIFNSNNSSKTFSLSDYGIGSGTWNICINDEAAGTDVLGTIKNNQVTVAPISAMVLVKGDTIDTDSVYKRAAEAERGIVKVNYVDEDGKILSSDKLLGYVGDAYSTTAISISGYTLKTTPANARGLYTVDDIAVTYVYTKTVIDNPQTDKPIVNNPQTDKPTVKVSAMKGFNYKKRTYNSITLKWTKNTSADGYVIQQYKKGKWTTVKTITANKTTSYKVKGLKASSAYKFRIRAYKSNGSNKVYSSYVTKSIKTIPSNVKKFRAATKNSKTITLKWTKNTSADGYVIQQKKGKKWKTIKTITKKSTTSFKVTRLKKSKKYQFRIRAYKKNGKAKLYSGYSTVSVKTTKK